MWRLPQRAGPRNSGEVKRSALSSPGPFRAFPSLMLFGGIGPRQIGGSIGGIGPRQIGGSIGLTHDIGYILGYMADTHPHDTS